MNKTLKIILLVIVSLTAVFLIFWFTKPQAPIVSTIGNTENIVSEMKKRSFYTKLPIVYSSDKVGKDDPFK